MNRAEKRCLVEYLGVKYRRSKKKVKSEIIAEVCDKLSIGNRQARRLLSAMRVGRPRKPDFRGRPSKYQDAEFKNALKGMWKSTNYMCSRHLKSAIPEWLPYVENESGKFEPSIHGRLLSISAPTIDRILKPYKALKGKSSTRSGGFREEIPIQENVWDIQKTGYMEADTVAHCGGSLLGEYINSLTMVDIATIWTEVRAVYGKASMPIVEAIEAIENSLPFEIACEASPFCVEVSNSEPFESYQTQISKFAKFVRFEARKLKHLVSSKEIRKVIKHSLAIEQNATSDLASIPKTITKCNG